MGPDETHFYKPVSHRINRYPGWESADDSRKSFIRQSARDYLLEHSDGYKETGGRTDYSDPRVAAIWLLRDEIAENKNLKQAIKAKWLRSITGIQFDDREYTKKLHEIAYLLNPEVVRDHWKERARKYITKDDYFFRLRKLSLCWDAKWAVVVSTLILQLEKSKTIKSAIMELANLDFKVAEETSLKLVEQFKTKSSEDQQLAASIAAGLIIGSKNIWAAAYPLLIDDTKLSSVTFLMMADNLDKNDAKLFTELSTEELGALCQMLYELFPPEADPPMKSDIVTRRGSIQYLRNSIPRIILAVGTSEASSELNRLAEALQNESEWLHRYAMEARSLQRQKSWEPATIKHVTTILNEPNKRWVRTNDELLELVCDSLGRLQCHLNRSDLPAKEDLWNYDGAGNQRKNFRHKDEESVSDYIARWVRDDIGKSAGVVANREVQPVRGLRTDILIQAPVISSNSASSKLNVTIEVKGCWNPEIKNSAEAQLINDYLVPHGRTHGIYLIAWFYCDKCTSSSKSKIKTSDIKKARSQVSSYIPEVLKPDLSINDFVLDCRI